MEGEEFILIDGDVGKNGGWICSGGRRKMRARVCAGGGQGGEVAGAGRGAPCLGKGVEGRRQRGGA